MSIEEIYQKHGMVVIDNLVPEDELDELRWYALNNPPDDNHKFRGGYVSIAMDDSFPLYKKFNSRAAGLLELFCNLISINSLRLPVVS